MGDDSLDINNNKRQQKPYTPTCQREHGFRQTDRHWGWGLTSLPCSFSGAAPASSTASTLCTLSTLVCPQEACSFLSVASGTSSSPPDFSPSSSSFCRGKPHKLWGWPTRKQMPYSLLKSGGDAVWSRLCSNEEIAYKILLEMTCLFYYFLIQEKFHIP